MNKQKVLGLGLVTTVIIITTLTVSYFSKSSTQISDQTQTPNSSLISNETDNWKTYTNEVYGISFKYPLSGSAKKCGGESTNKPDIISGFADGTEKDCVYIENSTGYPTIDLNISDMSFAKTYPVNKETESKGTFTTVSGKRTYITIVEASSTNVNTSKQVFIEQSPTKVASLVGRYDGASSITLFDTILSTLQLK